MSKLFSRVKDGFDIIFLKKCSESIHSRVVSGRNSDGFFLQLIGDQKKINFNATGNPEFDGWEWVNYWYPVSQVVSFKQNVYRQALAEFSNTNTRFQRRKKRR